MSFSDDIKKSATDEWYTPPECVEIIVPYLRRGGGIKKYFVRSTKKRVSSYRCYAARSSTFRLVILRPEQTFLTYAISISTTRSSAIRRFLKGKVF